MNPNQESNFAQDTYQTGSTKPPKSHNGIITLLLVLVIFLCGISTALGLMNIRLLDALKQSDRETSPVAFSGAQGENPAEDTWFSLGFSGLEIPELWRLYQELPEGIYITEVTENSDAAAKGILPGDILLQVDNTRISTAAQLTSLLESQKEPVQVTLYRNGGQIELTLTPITN